MMKHYLLIMDTGSQSASSFLTALGSVTPPHTHTKTFFGETFKDTMTDGCQHTFIVSHTKLFIIIIINYTKLFHTVCSVDQKYVDS